LIKRARDSGRNWKKRYFVLNDNTFTYYASNTSLSSPKGDLLLVDDTVIVDEQDMEGQKYVFKVVTPFETMIMSAESNEDRNSWKLALMKALDLVQHSLRGYMITKGATLLEKSVRKFFVFHEKTLYVHKDHEHTTSCLSLMKISEASTCKLNDVNHEIIVTDDKGLSINMIFEQRNIHEIMIWYEALQGKINKMKAETKTNEIRANLEAATIKGILGVRPPHGGETWKIMFVSLVKNDIVLMSIDTNGTPQGITEVFHVMDNAVVTETSIRPNAFEVISNDRILHLCTKTREGMEDWMRHLNALVVQRVVTSTVTTVKSKTLSNDIIHMDALELIPKDTFYEVQFTENKAIGIVLERAGEWAITKIADFKETGVKTGSALTFVNGETVIFDEYKQTIGRFKNWKPPLSLIFRVSPSKFGYLKKRLNSSNGTIWRKYYFQLDEGKLCYKNSEEVTEKMIQEIPLVGALVAFVSKEEAGKKYCFKFISGASCLVLHARSTEEMREWAAILYHAIAIANGGKHIIEFERQRLIEEELREQALKLQKVEEETAYLLELIQNAVVEENIENLRLALEAAENAGVSGEFVDYAKEFLVKLTKSHHAHSLPDVNYAQSYNTSSSTVYESVVVTEEGEEDVEAYEAEGDEIEEEVNIIEIIEEDIEEASSLGLNALLFNCNYLLL
jgi:hypothetical protein